MYINLTVDDHEKRLGLLEECFVRLESKIARDDVKSSTSATHTSYSAAKLLQLIQ